MQDSLLLSAPTSDESGPSVITLLLLSRACTIRGVVKRKFASATPTKLLNDVVSIIKLSMGGTVQEKNILTHNNIGNIQNEYIQYMR